MLAAGDQVIARPLGRGCRQDRGLHLEKAHFGHLAAQERDHLRAQHDLVVYLGIAQIKEAVFQPYLLLGLGGGSHLERKIAGAFAQHRQGFHPNLDRAGGDFGIVGVLAALDHLAADADRAFPVHLAEQRIVVDHRLHHAVMIPHIQELDTAVVADILHPAGNPDLPADIALTQLPAVVGTIDVRPRHNCFALSSWYKTAFVRKSIV